MNVTNDKRREIVAKVRDVMGELTTIELDGVPLADLIEPSGADELAEEYGGADALGLVLGIVDDVYCRVVDPCACGVPHDDRDMLLSAVREIEDALDCRLMPEGMEWPRYDDGESFVPGDDRSVEFFGDNIYSVWINGSYQFLTRGKRIKRPAPKALDADGVEIRVGDTVWTDYGDGPWTVTSITADYAQHVRGESDELGSLDMPPNTLTHRSPVLAADGRPLREGEHVYHVETGAVLVVKELPKPGEYQAVVVFAPPASHLTSFDPDQLTHERPVADSWERLEDDATKPPYAYCVEHGLDDDSFPTNEKFARDLVRRAKALAERGK